MKRIALDVVRRSRQKMDGKSPSPIQAEFESLAELLGDSSRAVSSVTLPGKVELAPTSP